METIKQYKEGKMSLGTAAKSLDLSISECLNALAELGIPPPITYEDFLEEVEHLKKVF